MFYFMDTNSNTAAHVVSKLTIGTHVVHIASGLRGKVHDVSTRGDGAYIYVNFANGAQLMGLDTEYKAYHRIGDRA